MRIKDYVRPDWILVDLPAQDKSALFEQLAEALHQRLPSLGQAELLQSLQEREQQASTGIGSGVAVPHSTIDGAEGIACLLATLPGGIDFESIDGEPVYFVCVLLGPPGAVGDHLRLLARIARLIRRPEFVESLRQAASPAEVHQLMVEEDERHVE